MLFMPVLYCDWHLFGVRPQVHYFTTQDCCLLFFLFMEHGALCSMGVVKGLGACVLLVLAANLGWLCIMGFALKPSAFSIL